MSKFQVGDRVAVYQGYSRWRGQIKEITGSGLFVVRANNGVIAGAISPKQCRKLVKKERRRVWLVVPTYGVGSCTAYFDYLEAAKQVAPPYGRGLAEVREFVEVRRGKK